MARQYYRSRPRVIGDTVHPDTRRVIENIFSSA